jgi:hypothetical protein
VSNIPAAISCCRYKEETKSQLEALREQRAERGLAPNKPPQNPDGFDFYSTPEKIMTFSLMESLRPPIIRQRENGDVCAEKACDLGALSLAAKGMASNSGSFALAVHRYVVGQVLVAAQ